MRVWLLLSIIIISFKLISRKKCWVVWKNRENFIEWSTPNKFCNIAQHANTLKHFLIIEMFEGVQNLPRISQKWDWFCKVKSTLNWKKCKKCKKNAVKYELLWGGKFYSLKIYCAIYNTPRLSKTIQPF